MYVSVLEVGLGGALGVDGGWMPLPTHPLEKSEATLSIFSIPAIIVRKYASNLDERKTANSSHPPPSLFWRSMFFSALFGK